MKEEALSCPRCGYDLSGQVATWADACPLTGTCSECGYGLEWELVFRRQAGVAWWLFELDELGRVRGFVRTVAEGLRPARFWTAVRVEDWPRIRRLAAFLVVLVLMVHLGIAALSGGIVAKRVWGPWIPISWPPSAPYRVPPPGWSPQSNGARLVDALTQGASVALNPYVAWSLRWRGVVRVSPLGPSFVSGVIALCLLPLTIGAARGIFREGRAKSAHFWRVWIYGWIGPAAMVLVSAVLALQLMAWNLFPAGALLPHYEAGILVRPDPTIWLGPAMFAWAARWWHVAAAKYLKWERPLAVSVSACVASFFLVFGVALLWMGWDYVMAI